MKVGILSYEQFANAQKDSVGSTRIRCTWVLPHMREAEEFKIGTKYDAVIFQKAYFIEYLKVYDGVKILDLCDPDWMEGKPVIEAAEYCDAVTCASQGLYDYVSKILDIPVYFVPDRIDPDAHQQRKKHEGRAKRAVWYGYHTNQQILDPVLPALKRLGLELTVISDFPYYPASAIAEIDRNWLASSLKNVKYDPQTINDEIVAGGDFVINYRPDTGKFPYKSENKTLISWAIGMPVARTAEEMERFIDPVIRTHEAESRLAEVAERWTSDKMAQEYRQVIAECIERRRGLGI